MSNPRFITAAEDAALNPFRRHNIVTLTNDQILALPSMPVEIIPAPGDGIINVPMLCVVRFNWVADYSNIGAEASMFLAYSGGYVSNMMAVREQGIGAVSGFLQVGCTSILLVPTAAAIDGTSNSISAAITAYCLPSINNAAVLLYGQNGGGTGDWQGGDPGNSFEITTFYFQITA